MDSGYFNEEIIETIESLICKCLIKAKVYTTLAPQVTALSAMFVKGTETRENSKMSTKFDTKEKKEDLWCLA